MTTKPVKAQDAARRVPPLPDPPPKGFLPFRHFVLPNVPGILATYLKAHPFYPSSATLVSGYGYICRNRADYAGCPSPNLVVAFDVDCDSIISANGYVIEEVGKPPGLVLEVASPDNGRREYIQQREMYADFGIPEFWQFDYTGGNYHDAPLACDVLTDGSYQPMALTTEPDGVIWGYSEVLGLSVCWVEGRLRFWDRVQKRYLPYHSEDKARADAEAARADREAARANAEAARADREAARVRELEEELRRRDIP